MYLHAVHREMSSHPQVCLLPAVMATRDSPASTDTHYFAQLRGQAEEALSKTERRACSLVAQVLQAHALLGATVGLPLKAGQQQQQQLVGSISKIEKQVHVCVHACVCSVV